MPTRRQIVRLIGALAVAPTFARAEERVEYALVADDGAPVQNFRIPVELDPAKLPGIIWRGDKSADVILYEFFDYNCAFCRKAQHDIEALLANDPKTRLGLVNYAILSIGSVQAAKVQQAVLRLFGPKAAYDFHSKLFSKRGQIDGATALAVARELGLDPKKIEESGDSPSVSATLTQQAKLAESLDMGMTPSFAIAGVGLLGWPGPQSLRKIIANVRKCDRPLCEEKG
ncbi:MAG: DsbA family protein [Methylocystis sp.]